MRHSILILHSCLVLSIRTKPNRKTMKKKKKCEINFISHIWHLRDIAEMRWVHSYGHRLRPALRRCGAACVNYGQTRVPVFNTLSKMQNLSFHVHDDDDDFIRMPFGRAARVSGARKKCIGQSTESNIFCHMATLNVRGNASCVSRR